MPKKLANTNTNMTTLTVHFRITVLPYIHKSSFTVLLHPIISFACFRSSVN